MHHSESSTLYRVVCCSLNHFLCLCWLVCHNQQDNSVIFRGQDITMTHLSSTIEKIVWYFRSHCLAGCVVQISIELRCVEALILVSGHLEHHTCHTELELGGRRPHCDIFNYFEWSIHNHKLFGNSVIWYSLQIGELNFSFLVEPWNYWSCESLLMEKEKYLRKPVEK